MLMSFLIGCIQIFALIPGGGGASRSGVVIMAGLIFGFKFEGCLKVFFFTTIPTILGALVFLIEIQLHQILVCLDSTWFWVL